MKIGDAVIVTVDQIDDLQAGDIVLFMGDDLRTDVPPNTMGLIVDSDTDLHDEPAVLIQFYGGDDFATGPLHYYHKELDEFLEMGEIRIIHAS